MAHAASPPASDGHQHQQRTMRVVAHLDLDCFYVQVAQRLQPELKGRPTAVKQYKNFRGGGLIAVGYEARAKGVTRNMRGDEAREKCPDLELVSVPMAHGKADLTIYRDAGTEVISVLRRLGRCERASIDEVYLDLTEAAATRLQANKSVDALLPIPAPVLQSHILAANGGEVERAADWLVHAVGENRHVAAGAALIAEARAAVLAETGFTCSAGIAHNKMLAKMASGMHKPNQQTVVPSDAVEALLKDLPVKKLKQLGGKLGAAIVEQLGIGTIGELARVREDRLQSLFGQNTGTWLWRASRGLHDEAVQERVLPKSHSCGKTFRGPDTLTSLTQARALCLCDAPCRCLDLQYLSDTHQVGYWLGELAQELDERLTADFQQHGRTGRLLTTQITFSNAEEPSGKSQSRSCPLRTSAGAEGLAADAFACARKMLAPNTAGWGVTSMFIAATGMAPAGADPSVMSRFLQSTRPDAELSSPREQSAASTGVDDNTPHGDPHCIPQQQSPAQRQSATPVKAVPVPFPYDEAELDESVMAELPEELQRELRAALRVQQQNRAGPSSADISNSTGVNNSSKSTHGTKAIPLKGGIKQYFTTAAAHLPAHGGAVDAAGDDAEALPSAAASKRRKSQSLEDYFSRIT
eukprot:jgi/Chlat1/5030/Chrsp32S04993